MRSPGADRPVTSDTQSLAPVAALTNLTMAVVMSPRLPSSMSVTLADKTDGGAAGSLLNVVGPV